MGGGPRDRLVLCVSVRYDISVTEGKWKGCALTAPSAHRTAPRIAP